MIAVDEKTSVPELVKLVNVLDPYSSDNYRRFSLFCGSLKLVGSVTLKSRRIPFAIPDNLLQVANIHYGAFKKVLKEMTIDDVVDCQVLSVHDRRIGGIF